MHKALLVAATAISVIGSAAPANAHVVRVSHSQDVSRVSANHLRVVVNDRECDGNGVFAIIYHYTLTGDWIQSLLTDGNGCAEGGSLFVSSGLITHVQTCEVRNTGAACSAMTRTP